MTNKVKYYSPKYSGVMTVDMCTKAKGGFEYEYNRTGPYYCALLGKGCAKCGNDCSEYDPHSRMGWGRCTHLKWLLRPTGVYLQWDGRRYRRLSTKGIIEAELIAEARMKKELEDFEQRIKGETHNEL